MHNYKRLSSYVQHRRTHNQPCSIHIMEQEWPWFRWAASLKCVATLLLLFWHCAIRRLRLQVGTMSWRFEIFETITPVASNGKAQAVGLDLLPSRQGAVPLFNPNAFALEEGEGEGVF